MNCVGGGSWQRGGFLYVYKQADTQNERKRGQFNHEEGRSRSTCSAFVSLLTKYKNEQTEREKREIDEK